MEVSFKTTETAELIFAKNRREIVWDDVETKPKDFQNFTEIWIQISSLISKVI